MSVSGFQNFWVAGSRAYFKRDTTDEGTQFPWIDLGVINPINPAITATQVQLLDSDGGRKRIVATAVPQIEEKYDITVSNLNLENLALLFMADAPEAFTQAAAGVIGVDHRAFPGRLIKVLSADEDTPIYMLTKVVGVYIRDAAGDLTVGTITTIVASTKTITISEDVAAEFDVGDKIIVQTTGLANLLNAGTYTVVSATDLGATTAIVVEEDFAANETAITGGLLYKADSGDSGTIYGEDVDWETVSADRGMIRMIDGGALVAEDDVKIDYVTAAITGNRLFNPQSLEGNVQGRMILIWGRDNNDEQTAREMNVFISPNGSNVTADDFSNIVLSVTVLNDLTAAIPAGRMIQFKGGLPDLS